MRILMTGGSGFIASYFVEPLVTAGHDVVNYDLQSPPKNGPAAKLQHILGDIRDGARLATACQGCQAVLHLAAAHHDFGIEHDTYYDVNERGSRILCEAMDAAGIRDVCFYSTVAVYGDAPEPHHEDSEKRPNSPYGGSKLAGEKVFGEWTGRGGGRRCLVIRPTVTFGARNFANMYSLIRQIHTRKFINVGSGANIKSLSYVENIVDATLYLWGLGRATSPAFMDGGGAVGSASGGGQQIFNFIDKPDLTSRAITAAVYEALGRRAPSFSVPMALALLGAMPFDLVIKLTGKNLPVSSARIRKLADVQTKFEADKLARTGFTPKVPLREGIRRMAQWYLAEGQNQSAEWHQPPAAPLILPPTKTPAAA